MGLASPMSSVYGRLTTSNGGSPFSQSSSFINSLRWFPSSPLSIETVISPRNFGLVGSDRRAAHLSIGVESQRRSSRRGVRRKSDMCCCR
jgi:hypothetical protein